WRPACAPEPVALPAPLLLQPTTAVPVTVTSPTLTPVASALAPAHAFPFRLPRVRVIAAPARMLPWKAVPGVVVVEIVAAWETHQVTLHAWAPLAKSTAKLVPVRAPVPAGPELPILNSQVALALPAASRVNVTSVAVNAA